MVSSSIGSGSVPWAWQPAREFPITRWQRQRYGFILPPLRFATQPAPAWRPFPARLWVEAQQQIPGD